MAPMSLYKSILFRLSHRSIELNKDKTPAGLVFESVPGESGLEGEPSASQRIQCHSRFMEKTTAAIVMLWPCYVSLHIKLSPLIIIKKRDGGFEAKN